MSDRPPPIKGASPPPADLEIEGADLEPEAAPELPLGAVRQRSLSEEVADRLREGILTGLFRPGRHLREVDLAQSLEVSRGPVRDALAQLHREGLVTLRLHHGAVVVGMSRHDVEDLFSLRLSLETLAVRLATERATPADLAALHQAASPLPDHPPEPSQREFVGFDIAFHSLLYRAAHHDRLYATWTMLRPHVSRFLLARSIADSDYSDIFATEHPALADIIAARDGQAAQAMIAAHLEGAFRRLVSAFADDEGTSAPEAISLHRSPASTPVRAAGFEFPHRATWEGVTEQ
jgi:DNA-binding GntR family transcriptional regulator